MIYLFWMIIIIDLIKSDFEPETKEKDSFYLQLSIVQIMIYLTILFISYPFEMNSGKPLLYEITNSIIASYNILRMSLYNIGCMKLWHWVLICFWGSNKYTGYYWWMGMTEDHWYRGWGDRPSSFLDLIYFCKHVWD